MTSLSRVIPILAIGLWALFLGSPSQGAAPDAYFNAGNTYMRQGHYDKAIPYFRATLNLEPNHALAYEGLARCYYQLGQYDQAYEASQKGLQIYPESTILQAINERLGPRMAKPPMPEVQGPGKVVKGGRVIKEGPMLAPVFWIKGTAMVDYSLEGDLNQAVQGWKSGASSGGVSNIDAFAGNLSFGPKLEYGYNIDPWDGIALDLSWMVEDGFHGKSSAGNADLFPSVIGFEMNYYLFWPHDDCRYSIWGGVGYYYGLIYSSGSVAGLSTFSSQAQFGPSGLYGNGDFGVNLGAGYELRVEDNLGLELSLDFRYVTISTFQMTDTSSGVVFGIVSLPDGFVTPVNTKDLPNIPGAKFLTMDLTGVQLGISVNKYIF